MHVACSMSESVDTCLRWQRNPVARFMAPWCSSRLLFIASIFKYVGWILYFCCRVFWMWIPFFLETFCVGSPDLKLEISRSVLLGVWNIDSATALLFLSWCNENKLLFSFVQFTACVMCQTLFRCCFRWKVTHLWGCRETRQLFRVLFVQWSLAAKGSTVQFNFAGCCLTMQSYWGCDMNRIHMYPEEARLCFSLCFCVVPSCSLWLRPFFHSRYGTILIAV